VLFPLKHDAWHASIVFITPTVPAGIFTHCFVAKGVPVPFTAAIPAVTQLYPTSPAGKRRVVELSTAAVMERFPIEVAAATRSTIGTLLLMLMDVLAAGAAHRNLTGPLLSLTNDALVPLHFICHLSPPPPPGNIENVPTPASTRNQVGNDDDPLQPGATIILCSDPAEK
jgi:hypothetical protein